MSGVCSVSCGGGTATVTRQCTNPAPSCGGSNCTGSADYVKQCNSRCCPGIDLLFQLYVQHVRCTVSISEYRITRPEKCVE